jgi:hypothetical protein
MADPFNPAPGSDIGAAIPLSDQEDRNMDTMELRLSALAARGFRVSVQCGQTHKYEQEQGVKFSATLSKGQEYGSGGSMQSTGSGWSLAEAVGAALAAAEAFLDHPGPPAAVRAAQIDMAKALPMGAAE